MPFLRRKKKTKTKNKTPVNQTTPTMSPAKEYIKRPDLAFFGPFEVKKVLIALAEDEPEGKGAENHCFNLSSEDELKTAMELLEMFETQREKLGGESFDRSLQAATKMFNIIIVRDPAEKDRFKKKSFQRVLRLKTYFKDLIQFNMVMGTEWSDHPRHNLTQAYEDACLAKWELYFGGRESRQDRIIKAMNQAPGMMTWSQDELDTLCEAVSEAHPYYGGNQREFWKAVADHFRLRKMSFATTALKSKWESLFPDCLASDPADRLCDVLDEIRELVSGASCRRCGSESVSCSEMELDCKHSLRQLG